jgi:hypothetical protein
LQQVRSYLSLIGTSVKEPLLTLNGIFALFSVFRLSAKAASEKNAAIKTMKNGIENERGKAIRDCGAIRLRTSFLVVRTKKKYVAGQRPCQ